MPASPVRRNFQADIRKVARAFLWPAVLSFGVLTCTDICWPERGLAGREGVVINMPADIFWFT